MQPLWLRKIELFSFYSIENVHLLLQPLWLRKIKFMNPQLLRLRKIELMQPLWLRKIEPVQPLWLRKLDYTGQRGGGGRVERRERDRHMKGGGE